MSNRAVEQIKERLSVVEVVSQYVQLSRAGKNYKGLSPFNPEKTPSFYVSPERGMYYCFSSGKGGDIFTFVQEMEGVDFRGALKILAERAGVELSFEGAEHRDARERLYALLEEATMWFTKQLAAHSDAQAYVRFRGITLESESVWRLGFAPADWKHVSEYLGSLGFTEEECMQAGMVKRGEKGGYYERFRSRIMFPVSDSAGRVVGFSGRLFGDAGKDTAKYLNSPESALYDKSRILYGYSHAKNSIRKHDFAILVEGQMDLVLSHQVGFTNTVAASGTALSEVHLGLIKRMTDNIVMAFDADVAGLRAGARAARLALLQGMQVKVARLTPGADPADMVRTDPASWKRAVRESIPLIDFYLEATRIRAHDEDSYARAVRSDVLPLVSAMTLPIERARAVARIAQTLNVPAEAVTAELVDPVVRAEATSSSARTSLAMPRSEALLRSIIGVVWLSERVPDELEDAREHIHSFIATPTYREASERLLSEKDKLLFETELAFAEQSNKNAYVLELFREYATECIRGELSQIKTELRRAEAAGDEQRVTDLLVRAQELGRAAHET